MSKPKGTPFDDVFKTLVRDVPKILLFFLNEMFRGDIVETYDGTENVTPLDKEDVVYLPSGVRRKKASDSRFKVQGRGGERKFHIECQTNPDGSMALRLFEYDSLDALDGAKSRREYSESEIPHSGLLYLRHNENTPTSILVHIITPGGKVDYRVPVVKIGDYSVDDIIKKKLYFLIPFHLFSYERELGRKRISDEVRGRIAGDYGKLKSFLIESERYGVIDAYEASTIARMCDMITENLTKDEEIREEVAMVGKILEYPEKDILNKGIAQGQSKERDIDNRRYYKLVSEGKLKAADAAEVLQISEKEFLKNMQVCGYNPPED